MALIWRVDKHSGNHKDKWEPLKQCEAREPLDEILDEWETEIRRGFARLVDPLKRVVRRVHSKAFEKITEDVVSMTETNENHFLAAIGTASRAELDEIKTEIRGMKNAPNAAGYIALTASECVRLVKAIEYRETELDAAEVAATEAKAARDVPKQKTMF